MLSRETLVSRHPWTKDVQLELDRIEKEEAKQRDMFDNYETTFDQKQGEQLNKKFKIPGLRQKK